MTRVSSKHCWPLSLAALLHPLVSCHAITVLSVLAWALLAVCSLTCLQAPLLPCLLAGCVEAFVGICSAAASVSFHATTMLAFLLVSKLLVAHLSIHLLTQILAHLLASRLLACTVTCTLPPSLACLWRLTPCTVWSGHSIHVCVSAGGFARLAGFNGGRHLFELCLLPDQSDNR